MNCFYKNGVIKWEVKNVKGSHEESAYTKDTNKGISIAAIGINNWSLTL